MDKGRFVRSLGFRLGAIYAGLFCLSVLVLLGICFFIISTTLRDQLHRAILEDTADLTDEYGREGAAELIQEIRTRDQSTTYEDSFYLYCSQQDAKIAGNVDGPCPTVGWSTVTQAAKQKPNVAPGIVKIELLTNILPDGMTLSVGASTAAEEETKKAIIEAFGWAMLITSLLAIAGGRILSRSFLHRIDGINKTARAVSGGDLRSRVHVGGDRDEIDVLSANLNAMLDRIATLVESLEQVSTNIAHDLRTPLTRLRQRLDLAKQQATSPDQLTETIDLATREADSILETFAAVLRIAQLEGGVPRSGFSEVDLSALLENLIEIYTAVAEDDGYIITSNVSGGMAVLGDRHLLTQMFVNLIENALRHTPKGTTVNVGLARTTGIMTAVIEDNGPGIPTDLRDKVFERFYRIESSRHQPGSGLGLALVKAIATLHSITLVLDDHKPGLRISAIFPKN